MNRTSSRAAIFYVVMTVGLVVLVTKTQANFLPAGLSSQIGHNSEALLFAIVVAAEIQLLRGRRRTTALLATMVVIGLALIGLGLLLKGADFRSSIVTLNEPLIGSGFVLLYLCLPRSRATAVAVTVAVALYVIIFFNTDFVLDQAESLVPLALAGPALDVFDRTILRPHRAGPARTPCLLDGAPARHRDLPDPRRGVGTRGPPRRTALHHRLPATRCRGLLGLAADPRLLLVLAGLEVAQHASGGNRRGLPAGACSLARLSR